MLSLFASSPGNGVVFDPRLRIINPLLPTTPRSIPHPQKALCINHEGYSNGSSKMRREVGVCPYELLVGDTNSVS